MNKVLIAIALCAALAACKKDDAAANATAGAAATPADAVAVAPANTGLPTECEDYLNRVKACVAKSGGGAAADQFQKGLDQSKAQWDAVADKASLIPACKAANDQFAQMAVAMKCE